MRSKPATSGRSRVSTRDPDIRRYREELGKDVKLSFIGHGSMENRNGVLDGTCVTPADGHAERVQALVMIEPRRPAARDHEADDAEDLADELRS